MTKSEIVRTQRRVGTIPDSWWGPKSIAACQKYLRSLMPSRNPWPETDQASLTAFYGRAGTESRHTQIAPPYPMYFDGARISAITVHEKCAESLLRVLTELSTIYTTTVERRESGVSVYDGCYNNRLMRGGSIPSLHARAAAIDLDAEHNGNLETWPVVAIMPIEVMECFAREGWVSAGAFWGRDAMHFQATR